MFCLPHAGLLEWRLILESDFINIGNREGWGNSQPFGISKEDQRHHIYIIGKTGSGKTTLLRNLIIQHIALGHGVGVIDPHGDLAEELLNHIPPSRADHLVYFNPGDIEFPIGLNLLANVAPDDRPLVASGIVSAFKGIWRDSWGPRLEYILYNAVAALLDCRNATLLGVNRMLVDDEFRAKVIRQIKDPFIKAFWAEEYANYDERFKREAIAPIQNKLGQFLLNPVIRNILGQVRNKVSIPFVMDNSRLFIANLSKGKLGEDKANLLGSLLTTQFQLGAMARANRPENERRDFYLFIDEFQNFSTDAFASVLAEARKYRSCLTLSHQYIDQLPLPIRQAVFGNAGTLISFRIGNTDAEVMAKEFGNTFPPSVLVDLDKYEAVVKLLVDGINKEPFRGKMLPPLENRVGRRDKLIRHSRERFAMPRSKIERKLNRWMNSQGGQPTLFSQN
ncbi:MAG TPA: type IV secretion system DNA-binding domain-containing protein [Verrucomicrobiae bacterium]|nr:type IV secretion system DNA-binding domain-containing protein [Verrucomicrobiae bacterium]